MTTTLKAFLASGLLLASSVATAETIERDICVFDIAGKVGPTMAAMQDWRTEAMNWGLDANLKVYTNESVVAEDLKAGVCDAALMTGIRARQFNTYAGTLDSIGAIPTMEHMKIALQVLAHPNSADKLTANSYEVMGIAPIGAASLLFAAAFTELPLAYQRGAWGIVTAHPLTFLASALLGLAASFMTFLVIKVTNSVTLKVLNTARNAGFVLFTVTFLGEPATALQLAGYAISLTAFSVYTYYKLQEK